MGQAPCAAWNSFSLAADTGTGDTAAGGGGGYGKIRWYAWNMATMNADADGG